jgi:hypothetical protein
VVEVTAVRVRGQVYVRSFGLGFRVLVRVMVKFMTYRECDSFYLYSKHCMMRTL